MTNVITQPKTPDNLKDHKMKHTGERPFPCDECDYAAQTPGNLKCHFLKHEESLKWQIVCPYVDGGIEKYTKGSGLISCEKRFKMNFQLEYHIQAMHTTEGLVKKMKSEMKLVEFLKSKNCLFTRDCENFVSFQCKPELKTPRGLLLPRLLLTKFLEKIMCECNYWE